MNGPLGRGGRSLQLPAERNKLLLQLAEVPRGVFRVSDVLHSSYGTVSSPKHGVMCTAHLIIAFWKKRNINCINMLILETLMGMYVSYL